MHTDYPHVVRIIQCQFRRRGEKPQQATEEETDPQASGSSGDVLLWRLLPAVLVFRVLNAVLVRTQFDPDEYWQGLEPAHRIVYGQGHLTWEWAPGVEIRSWLHPLLLAAPLKFLQMTGLDFSSEIVAFVPRIFLQGTLLALADLSICRLAERIGASIRWALILTLTNWFMFYCGIRTYSNSFEGCLLVIALNFWPLSNPEAKKIDPTLALILAAISIMVRPSSVVSWLYLGLTLALFDYGILTKRFWTLVLTRVIPIGVVAVAGTVLIDRIFYGRYVLVLWNFFDYNVFRGLSSLYGVHSPHWYFTQCFPAILGIQLPFFLDGVYLSLRQSTSQYVHQRRRLLGLIFFGLLVLSLSAHKELRFAFPFLTIAIAFAAISLQTRCKFDSTQGRFVVALIAILGAIPAIYLSQIHQRAAIDVSFFLGRHGKGHIDLLLPCHAMPLYGVVHPPVDKVKSIRFLDCSPHLEVLRDVDGLNSSFKYRGSNETFAFKADPKQFVRDRYNLDYYPDMIVTGSAFAGDVQSGIDMKDFITCANFANAQDDVGGEMIVLCNRKTFS